MPFPLAHPAAVLPFRRYCPQLLAWPALIVGSLIPDASYLFKRWHLDETAHRVEGLFIFALPVGVMTVLTMYALRFRVLPMVPAFLRQIVEPLVQRAAPSIRAVAFSVLIGAGTHLAWDSFTHDDGWLVQRIPILETPVMRIGYRSVVVCHFLWYGCTVAGVACLGLAYQRWRETVRGRQMTSSLARWLNGLSLAVLVVPIGVLHHLFSGPFGTLVVVVSSALLLAGFAWWIERSFPRRT